MGFRTAWMRLFPLCLVLAGLAACPRGNAATVFVEAETFSPSSAGWKVAENQQTRTASRARTLWGWEGPGDATATRVVSLPEGGKHRVWVRHIQYAPWRGPFRVAVSAGGHETASHVLDLEPDRGTADGAYVWKSFDADLPAGDVTLTIAKHEQKNCSSYVRHVDCLLLTTDLALTPDHMPYGPQTFVRVTAGEGINHPGFMRIFADHYREPWYRYMAIGRDGLHDEAYGVPEEQKLRPGERSPWCNVTRTVYPDSGASLGFSLRHSSDEKAARLRARIEFGRCAGYRDGEPVVVGGPGNPPRPADCASVEVVKAFDVDAEPNGLVVIAPPDLESPRNVARLRRDRDYAEAFGGLADRFDWPRYGRRPKAIPFLVSANIGGQDLPVDAAVTAREQTTLDYFGFNGGHERVLGGLWFMNGDSFANPDLAKMKRQAAQDAEAFRKSGRRLDEIVCFSLWDEPVAQPASFMAQDAAYGERFRAWLRGQGLTPHDLLVKRWEDVRPVPETDRAKFPALHYYTQRFRTRALGDFMAAQRKVLESAYAGQGRMPPTLVNFSDGAVYSANFCAQGVDYFELLDADDQNAIWGEDWANLASTYQMGGYNVALMQAAARRRGQAIGHYLIAYEGRTAWDTKTKAVSETARGVRMWQNFYYGPVWGNHQGGPPWRTTLWSGRPELWRANAEVTREIGAVEDWLRTARPAPADVALVYSSSSDIWTMWDNLAFGFDRMHTWLALTHAQAPVDVVPEREIERGGLTQKVCYLSGPNLTRAAAEKLKAWVEAGGTLWLTAGAASRDEFNRPLDTLDALLPAERSDLATLAAHRSTGQALAFLAPQDTVTWDGQAMDVLSVKQSLKPKGSADVLATFKDGSPAVVSGPAGKGRVICCGFLPALSYIKPALDARLPLEGKMEEHQRRIDEARLAAPQHKDQPEATNAVAGAAPKLSVAPGVSPEDRAMLERSYNPWQFPAGVRERLLLPVRAAQVAPRLTCDTPLIDAVLLPCEQGWLIALSNFSSRPVHNLSLTVRDADAVRWAESVRRGRLEVVREAGTLRLTLPLDETDFIKLKAK